MRNISEVGWAELAKPIIRAGLKTRMMRLVPRRILHFYLLFE